MGNIIQCFTYEVHYNNECSGVQDPHRCMHDCDSGVCSMAVTIMATPAFLFKFMINLGSIELSEFQQGPG